MLLVSFGYKFGVPTDVDMVLDARFLPTRSSSTSCAPKTGCDPAVAELRAVERDEAQTFLRLVEALLDFTLPLYRREGRSYFTLAIGCTGGRHRSVALVDRLAQTRPRARHASTGPAPGRAPMSARRSAAPAPAVEIKNRLGLHARAARLLVAGRARLRRRGHHQRTTRR